MICKRCHSDKQSVFNGEVAIHSPGREGLEKPTVFVFPKLVVCFRCGLTDFVVPETELRILAQTSHIKEAVVSARGCRRSEKVTTQSPSGRMTA